MIKIEKTEVVGWEAAIRGMRNPKNSWERSDSFWDCENGPCLKCDHNNNSTCQYWGSEFTMGPNDLHLAESLRLAGTDHRKFMRMVVVYLDITAPLYWWKEFDTYKVGTVADSCSTMHKIAAKEFTMDDFSYEQLVQLEVTPDHVDYDPNYIARSTINCLNAWREEYLRETDNNKKKECWWQMIQLLPSSYNQKRTIMLNYEVLANMYKSRKNHKLDEWREFCKWIETLPYSQLITGECKKDEDKKPESHSSHTFNDIKDFDDVKRIYDSLRYDSPVGIQAAIKRVNPYFDICFFDNSFQILADANSNERFTADEKVEIKKWMADVWKCKNVKFKVTSDDRTGNSYTKDICI